MYVTKGEVFVHVDILRRACKVMFIYSTPFPLKAVSSKFVMVAVTSTSISTNVEFFELFMITPAAFSTV